MAEVEYPLKDARDPPRKPFSPNTPYERWFITVFVDDVDEFDPSVRLTKDGLAYGCWGFETCPVTNRLHWHLYCRFTTRKRLSAVKNWLERNDAHCEPAWGTEEQAQVYCWKDQPEQARRNLAIGAFDAKSGTKGRRSDLEEVAEAVKAGTPLSEVAQAHPTDWIRYHQGITSLSIILAPKPPDRRNVEVIVLFGPPQTGKTYRVMTTFPGSVYLVSAGRDPWGGYNGEKTICFDEWRDAEWPLQKMNSYCHEWTPTLDCRYRNKFGLWNRVVICTNYEPETFYQSDQAASSFHARIRPPLGHCHRITLREDQGGPSWASLMDSQPDF